MILPEWFKPTRSFSMGGVSWIASGHVAFAAPDPGGLSSAPDDSLMPYVEPATEAVQPGERSDGWALFGAQTFAAHYVDLVSANIPGASWFAAPSAHREALVARVDGVAVGLVMPCIVDAGEVCEGPDCPTCGGDGCADSCSKCDGSGAQECYACLHEETCSRCNGKGRVGKCPACHGSGKWSAPGGADSHGAVPGVPAPEAMAAVSPSAERG